MKYVSKVNDAMWQKLFGKSEEKTAKQDQDSDPSVASDSSGNDVM